MKKLFIISGIIGVVTLAACTDIQREPGRVYMPDMAYSRAYETYAQRDTASFTTDPNEWTTDSKSKIFYNNMPVAGSVSQEQDFVYHIPKDVMGDSTNYIASKQVANPLQATDSVHLKEAERLYLINCGICHGKALDGNGPLYKDGAGPYPAKPANLSGSDKIYANMPDGQMFYSITYGKNLMGSYAGQVTPRQRWMIINYIKGVQAKTAAPAAPAAGAATATTPVAGKDSAATK